MAFGNPALVGPGDITALQAAIARKARVFYGDVAPEAEAAGDVWIDPGPDGDELKLATGPGTGFWQLLNLVAAAVKAGAIDGKTITGTWFRTAEDGSRVEVGNPFGLDEVWWFGGYPNENPARMRELGNADRWKLLLWGGTHQSGNIPQMIMASESTADPMGTPSEIGWGSDRFVVDLFGTFGAGGDGSRGRFIIRDLDNVALPEVFVVDVRAKTVEIGVGYSLATRLRTAVDGRVTTVGDPRYAALGHAHAGVYSPVGHAHAAPAWSAVTGTKPVGERVSATTDATGTATFTHALGAVPAAIVPVIVTAAGGSRYFTQTAKTAANFSLQFYNGANAALAAGNTITVEYAAFP